MFFNFHCHFVLVLLWFVIKLFDFIESVHEGASLWEGFRQGALIIREREFRQLRGERGPIVLGRGGKPVARFLARWLRVFRLFMR